MTRVIYSIDGDTLRAELPPGDFLVEKVDGTTVKVIRGAAPNIRLGELVSNGAYYVSPLEERMGDAVTVTDGILDFPWQGFQKPRVSMPSTITVPAGVNEFWVPVDVDTTEHQSCHVVAEVANASGATVNTGSGEQKKAFVLQPAWYFHRGDDTRHWVRYVRPSGVSFSNGLAIKAMVKTYGAANADLSVLGCTVKFVTGAPAQVITQPFHRKHRTLDLTNAVRNYDLDPATMQHHDSGFVNGVPAWRSRLAHGYSQFGNGETGIYLNEDVPAFASVVQDPITTSEDAFGAFVNLHTYAFPAPFSYEAQSFKQQAVMLNGQRLAAVCGSQGVWSMRAITPNRKFAWPAFWLIGRRTDGSDAWPPEIDIMEQFNTVYGTDYPMTGYYSTCGQHWGDWGDERIGSATCPSRLNLRPGLAAMPSIWSAPHDYACAIDLEANEVTFFFDGVEVTCQRLCARKQDFSVQQYFPMMNVAVKSDRVSTLTPEQYNADGSGDMKIYDMSYYPSGWTFGEAA